MEEVVVLGGRLELRDGREEQQGDGERPGQISQGRYRSAKAMPRKSGQGQSHWETGTWTGMSQEWHFRSAAD